MSFLIVAGTVVSVSVQNAQRAKEEIGDRARAFDGTMRSTVRVRKRNWRVRTNLLTRTAADALEAVLEGTPPLACSGDMLGGSVNCFAEITGWNPVAIPGDHRVALEFTLWEA